MNAEEKIAKKYLEELKIGKVIFEPDGNIPPDFSISNAIGIEVRRLNENFENGEEFKGLEETRIPLNKLIREVFSEYNSLYSGKTYYVVTKYKRPFKQNFKKLKSEIRKKLDEFLVASYSLPHEVIVNSEFSLHFFKASPREGIIFRPAIDFDKDRGGWLIDLFSKNVRLSIDDKTKKISPYKSRYKEWWLLLVDTIWLDATEEDIEDYKAVLPEKKDFDKVLVLSAFNNSLIIEF